MKLNKLKVSKPYLEWYSDMLPKMAIGVVDDFVQGSYIEHPEFERWAGVIPDVFKNEKLSCSL
ncbi:MAG: hypothetical protein DSZ09_05600 [Sulfurovum sp.]|nr:MAG: hypothetical protein DSZ09_05600 [Sulfurovum sp.]